MLTSGDQKACQRAAARADRQRIAPYQRAYAACVRNKLHPERGGG